MERLKEFAIRKLEGFIGPFDWKSTRNGSSTTFTGNFLIYDRQGKIKLRIQGYIVEWQRLPAQVYIYNPPEFVKNHRHGSCLQLLRPGESWFKLHFDKPAKDFASAYTYVEHFLTEAYNLKR
ncbi:MAG: hypothetical protein ACR2MG_10840 [Pyrinomonadaceae bacterium]